MADRHASFFGPVLPQPAGGEEAFSKEQLLHIRARRIAADAMRCEPSAWPAERRHATLLPRARTVYPVAVDRVVSGIRVVVS